MEFTTIWRKKLISQWIKVALHLSSHKKNCPCTLSNNVFCKLSEPIKKVQMIQGFSTLNKDLSENLAWLTQNTSNSNTVNVIEL